MTTTSTTPAVAPKTYGNFFQSFLQGLGINVQGAQLAADEQGLASIANFEGLNTYYNPFNVTNEPEPGSSKYNSVGVEAYDSYATGLAGSIAFFSNPNPVWDQFLAGLKAGNESEVVSGADLAYQSWGSNGPPQVSNTRANEIITGSIGSGTADNLPGVPSTLDVIGGAVAKTATDPTGDLEDDVSAATSGLGVFKAIFSDLTTTDFWIRIGFIVLGLAILLIGIDKLSGGGLTGHDGGSATETIDVVTDKANQTTDSVKDTVREPATSSDKPAKAEKAIGVIGE